MSSDSSKKDIGLLVGRIVLGLIIVAAGMGVFNFLKSFAEKAEVETPAQLPAAVETQMLKKLDREFLVHLNGTVEAITQPNIVAEVSGRIVEVGANFVDGGVIQKDDLLVSIDDADYKSAHVMASAEITRINAQIEQLKAMVNQAKVGVESAQANEMQANAGLAVDDSAISQARAGVKQAERGVEQAQAAVALETSQREIAIAEWKEYAAKTGKDASQVPPLVAREPQRIDVEAKLASAQAGVEAAKASLDAAIEMKARSEQALEVAKAGVANAKEAVKVAEANVKVAEAQLQAANENEISAIRNLNRCEIRAPFAGRIEVTMVDLGQHLGMGQVVAKLVSLDKVQVRLPVAQDQIGFLGIRPKEDGTIEPVTYKFETTIGERKVEIDTSIVRYAPMVDASTRAFMLFAEIDNSKGATIRDTEGVTRSIPVLPGTFVQATIKGRTEKAVYEVKRSALRASAPTLVREMYPRAEWFLVTVTRSGEQVDDGHGTEHPEGLAHFAPVEIIRNEGETVVIREH
ncbi:MAG: HlyD family efflux transporter periplasmic adaptor subunit, partial [Planctomycetes bacterium]|nr:HlyD family efflux transporter periplasmic adaptor subunit [Planctomycetota bacterium]